MSQTQYAVDSVIGQIRYLQITILFFFFFGFIQQDKIPIDLAQISSRYKWTINDRFCYSRDVRIDTILPVISTARKYLQQYH